MKKWTDDIVPRLLLLCFAVLPLVLGLGYALLYSFGIVGTLSTGVTTLYWAAAFRSGGLISSFVYSIYLSIVSICLCSFGGLWLACHMRDRLRQGILSYFIYLPMAFPAVVTAFFFLQFLSNAGFLSRVLYLLGWVHTAAAFPGLVNDRHDIGIIMAQFFSTLPVFVLLFLSVIENENLRGLTQIAQTLGAGSRQTWWRLTLPLLMKKSAPTLVLYFIFKLGSYEVPLLLGRSSPETISVLTVRKMQRFNLLDIPQGYAIAVLYAMVVMLLLIVSLKPSKQEAYV